ncbi:VCBS repeat-containing protein [Cupriavidus basilensis]|uniref:VCBS repeat-containing protein n=1 Tax=Cupriavidus basilensis TaxID=68895 RepID=A0ABT6AX36_9BURK|nr:VCBS repeat-containing protein [Cupriavidus basilensis]MDF3836802.1 VCBS repeat-containing protein [Cupriavidus basilensis]
MIDKNWLRLMPVAVAAAVVFGCGGGGDGGGTDPTSAATPSAPAVPTTPPTTGPATPTGATRTIAAIEKNSSYIVALSNAMAALRTWDQFRLQGEFLTARAIADMDGDGVNDVVAAGGVFQVTTGTPMRFYKGSVTGFLDATAKTITGPVPSLVHARKMILGDYNGDGFLDVFVCAHGYDAPPFPGTTNAMLLSAGQGKWTAASQSWSTYVGFSHGCASGDVRGNGSADIFVTDSNNKSYFLANDGRGVFTQDTSRLPASLSKKMPIFTAEIMDVDSDGNLDLVVGGVEPDQGAMVFWGDGTGSYSDARSTAIPAVAGWQNHLHFAAEDIDADGVKELVVGRVPGLAGAPNFYQGQYIQVLKVSPTRTLTDVTAAWAGATNTSATTTVVNNAKPTWIEWVYVVDYDKDGKPDLVGSDEWTGNYWAKNNGTSFGAWQKIR